MIDAGYPCAARNGGFGDHPAERAECAGDDNHFSIHHGLPLQPTLAQN
jgi:hypothetical protein